MDFATDYKEILKRLDAIEPVKYARTRNFINGDVTCLSPYISRGVLTLPQVRDALLAKGYKPYQMEKFLQELGWREYFQRVWQHLGYGLFNDIKQKQQNVLHQKMPAAVNDAATGIDAIDQQIKKLYETGYLHNHVRMYVAGITCNLGAAHWLHPSRWMYYHLLDGDIASNTCSWQWVAGSFSSKKYIANQENINKYLFSTQTNTFLDKSYDEILSQPVPAVLKKAMEPQLKTMLPQVAALNTDDAKPLLLYNSYNLNVEWRKGEDANRILLLEPSHFEKFPVSDKVMAFLLGLAKNIQGLQIFTGEVTEIPSITGFKEIYSIEHQLSSHYPGAKDSYWWMFPEVTGYYQSFFPFWKKCERFLK